MLALHGTKRGDLCPECGSALCTEAFGHVTAQRRRGFAFARNAGGSGQSLHATHCHHLLASKRLGGITGMVPGAV
jgi:hypothetical protein